MDVWLNEGGAGEVHEVPTIEVIEQPAEMTDEEWNYLKQGGWRTRIEKTADALKTRGFPAEAHYLRTKNSELPDEPETTDERQAIDEVVRWMDALLRQPTPSAPEAPPVQLADDAYGADVRRRHLNRAEGIFWSTVATLIEQKQAEARSRGWPHANLKMILRDAFPEIRDVIQSMLKWCE